MEKNGENLSINLILEFTKDNVFLIIIFFILNVLCLIVETILISILLSNVFTSIKNGIKSDIKKYFIYLFIAFLFTRILTAFKVMVYNKLIPDFYYFIRTKLFEHLLNRYEEDYKEINAGNIIFNFEHFPYYFKNFFTELLQEYIPIGIAFLILIIYFFVACPLIGLVIFTFIIIVIIVVIFTLKNIIKDNNEMHIMNKKLNEHLSEKIYNLYDIYTSNVKEQELISFNEKEDTFKNDLIETEKNISTITIPLNFLCIFSFGICLCILYFKKDQLDPEKIISILIVLTYFLAYFIKFNEIYRGIANTFGYSEESNVFLQELIEYENFKRIDYPKLNTSNIIDFVNITFKYPEGTSNVMENFSLGIKKGNKIAIYGKSGKGKSTLAKILYGFYKKYYTGSIYINGINIKEINVAELRNMMSMMNQGVKLFEGSLYDNINYGINVDKEIIKNIINKIGIFENVDPDDNIGINGSKLSGGQKQMIAFLRTFLTNKDILILDEPTSALDQTTKDKFFKFLNGYGGNKTIIIITHDSDIKNHVDKFINF